MSTTSAQIYLPALLAKVAAGSILIMLAPVMIVNASLALCSGNAVYRTRFWTKEYPYPQFKRGVLKSCLLLLGVVGGRLSWVGHHPDDAVDTRKAFQPLGLVSLQTLHRTTGLALKDTETLVYTQARYKTLQQLALVVRYGLALALYQSRDLQAPAKFQVCGVEVDNLTMTEAVEGLLSENALSRARTACFVNVNSFNLAEDNPELSASVNDADLVFGDGSGVRLAARRKGIRLVDNVNGTDMLPHLCSGARDQGLSVYLLGAQDGVAEITAKYLQAAFPGLRIAGTHHGYFDHDNCAKLISRINHSAADIVLVALGSPAQEKWLKQYKAYLNARTVIAVGGLFDFYSGRISRAPLWFRELGMEWVWRLMQEPVSKFHRYAIGNPNFLFRIYFKKHTI